jgi:hypothetical protein
LAVIVTNDLAASCAECDAEYIVDVLEAFMAPTEGFQALEILARHVGYAFEVGRLDAQKDAKEK